MRDDKIEAQDDTIAALREENQNLGIRLSLSRAFVGVMQAGYNALLHYGVNFQDLPEYRDDKLLDEADEAADLKQGRSKYMQWIIRVEHAIAAAVRRKQWRVIAPKKDEE